MPRSEQINELATALCEAQGSFPILQKRTKAYNYMYADYAEIKECVQPVLQAHGLCITSDVDWEKGVLTMALVHTSGQSLTCPIKLHYKADGKVNEMQDEVTELTWQLSRLCETHQVINVSPHLSLPLFPLLSLPLFPLLSLRSVPASPGLFVLDYKCYYAIM
jgi:hypothetical protein